MLKLLLRRRNQIQILLPYPKGVMEVMGLVMQTRTILSTYMSTPVLLFYAKWMKCIRYILVYYYPWDQDAFHWQNHLCCTLILCDLLLVLDNLHHLNAITKRLDRSHSYTHDWSGYIWCILTGDDKSCTWLGRHSWAETYDFSQFENSRN